MGSDVRPFGISSCRVILYLCALNPSHLSLPAWVVMSALWDVCALNSSRLSPGCPPFWDLPPLPAWVVVFVLLEPLFFGFSPLPFLYIPARVVVSDGVRLFRDLCPRNSLHVSQLGSHALCPALPSQFFVFSRFIPHVRPFRISVFLFSLHNLAAWVMKCSPFVGHGPFYSLHLS